MCNISLNLAIEIARKGLNPDRNDGDYEKEILRAHASLDARCDEAASGKVGALQGLIDLPNAKRLRLLLAKERDRLQLLKQE